MSEESDEYVVQGMIAECQAGPAKPPFLHGEQVPFAMCNKCRTDVDAHQPEVRRG
jgi:hypothetical protein